MTLKTCIVCGASFVSKRSTQKTCSRECHRLRANELQRIRGQKNRTQYEITCAICGTAFLARHPGTKTCSRTCCTEWRRQRARELYRQLHPGREKPLAPSDDPFMSREAFDRMMAEIKAPPPDDLPIRKWRY